MGGVADGGLQGNSGESTTVMRPGKIKPKGVVTSASRKVVKQGRVRTKTPEKGRLFGGKLVRGGKENKAKQATEFLFKMGSRTDNTKKLPP